MKLSGINDWFTLIANIGVIGGLVFLGLEMQQNSRLVERELAIAESENIHGRIVESEFLSGILVKVGNVQGTLPVVAEYAEIYDMTHEEAQRWWRYVFQIWDYKQAEWIYRGRSSQDCDFFQLRFLDHQVFFKHMRENLDPDYVKCINAWYVEPSGNGT